MMSKFSLLKKYKATAVKNKNNGKVLDLFSGCGGLSLGFQRAGFEIVAGVDHDQSALKTYEKNLKAKALSLDLANDLWVEEFKKQTDTDRIDVLIGGPPCQGYSLTGTRNAKDPRNKLYNAMFVAADALKPKVILIENVRGMATLFDGKAKAQVVAEFQKRGYEVDAKVLDAADYGVPQHRLRLFFLAIKKEYGPLMLPDPLLEKDSLITCADAISDLPFLDIEKAEFESSTYPKAPENEYQKLMRNGSDSIANHEATRHKDFVIQTIKQVPEGGNHKDLPKGVGESRKFNEAWTRYSSQKPSRTIDTGHRNHFHYSANRVPTVRENARLQSFPDDFIVLGTRTAQNRQIGNAVPVLLAQAIALHVRRKAFA